MGLAVEGAFDDLLDTSDVDELEEERSPAGGIESFAAVLVGQPQEFLALAELRPREVAGQHRLHEASDVGTLAPSLAEQRVGVSPGVGSQLLGVVVIIGRAAAFFDTLVGLDELALDVDADQLAVAADPDAFADVTGGNGVEGLLELDVVIGVDFALGPHGRIESLAAEGLERGLLCVLEDDQGALAGGAVHALACGLEAPADRLALNVVAIDPLLAAEEALAQILDPALDVGLGVRCQLPPMRRIRHDLSG